MNPKSSNGSRRQLAAIMFTDIAGYTALMQADEGHAMEVLSRYRSTLHDAAVANGGDVLQHIGDGSLTMFQSAVQAVKCAIELQRGLQEIPMIPVRAGLHLGDVVIESDSVYGDGVNVASRIEQLADPGSILISQAIFESIRSQRKIRVKYLGTPRLRNVLEPMRVYAIRNRGVVVPDRLTRQFSVDLRSLHHLGIIAAGVIILCLCAFGLSRLFGGSSSGISVEAQLPELVISALENHSGNADFKDLGNLVSAQIAAQLNATNLVKICTPEKVTLKQFYRLKGGYYIYDNYCIYQLILLDGKSDQILTVLDPQISPVSEPLNAISGMTDQILGFWPMSNSLMSSGAKSPKYSAYQAYRNGENLLYETPTQAIQAYAEAIALDPGYLPPRLGMIHAHYLSGDLASAQRDLMGITDLNSIPEEDSRILFHWEYLLAGEYQRAFDTLYLNLTQHPKSRFECMQLARIALEHLQLPRKALEIVKLIVDSEDVGNPQTMAAVSLYQDILMQLHRYEQVTKTTRSINTQTLDPILLCNYARALGRLEQHTEIRTLFGGCKNRSFPFLCDASEIAAWAALEFALMGDSSASKEFVSLGLGIPVASQADEALMQFLGGHLNTAGAMYRQLASEMIDTLRDLDYSVRSAIAQLHAGDSTETRELIKSADQIVVKFSQGWIPYQLGRLNLAIGDRDQAIHYLELASAQGVPHRYGTFETDIFLSPLFQENRFLQLTEAKD